MLNGTAASFNLALPQLLVGKRKFPVVNLDDFITGIQAGYQFNGINFSGNYTNGEFFSLDGLHFSARGNALIANKFIETINNNYGAAIPEVNPGDYPSTQRP
ncbi:MAG: hypothetical protein EOO03_10650 [Chitinophagaceae bacterium]|nr:MAG: hypothetical protein EOO03_10650 [Chitinophagaceae bacterium]